MVDLEAAHKCVLGVGVEGIVFRVGLRGVSWGRWILVCLGSFESGVGVLGVLVVGSE